MNRKEFIQAGLFLFINIFCPAFVINTLSSLTLKSGLPSNWDDIKNLYEDTTLIFLNRQEEQITMEEYDRLLPKGWNLKNERELLLYYENDKPFYKILKEKQL